MTSDGGALATSPAAAEAPAPTIPGPGEDGRPCLGTGFQWNRLGRFCVVEAAIGITPPSFGPVWPWPPWPRPAIWES
jgi:hypothetical protein